MDRTETTQERHDRLAAEIAAARERLSRHEAETIGIGDVMAALSHELDEIVHSHGHDYVARHSAYDQLERRLEQAKGRASVLKDAKR